jgi:hypothetical protein
MRLLKNRAATIPLLIALVPFVFYLVVLFVYARGLFAFPFDYDQGEGFELYDAVRLSRGQNIYLDNAQYPFYASNYPPIYRLMLVPLIWLFGTHIWIGRVVTFACTLMCGALIFWAASAIHKNKPRNINALLIALICALAFLAANYVYHIAPLARAHMPMVMFAIAGVLLIELGSRAGSDRLTRTAKIGVALLIVAGFTKLQAIDGIAAGFAYLLFQQTRAALRAILISGIATALIVLLLNVLTQGQFWFNVVLANVNEYDIQQTWNSYAQWWQLQHALIVSAAIYVLWQIADAARARSLREISAWSLFFVFGCGMGMLTGKWGAGPTYLIACIAASCVCTARLFQRLFARDVSPLWVTALFAVVLLYQARLNVHLPTTGRFFGRIAQLLQVEDKSAYPPFKYYDSIGYTQLGHVLDPANTQVGNEIVRLVREAKGDVWSEEAMLTLLAGKPVITNPTQLYNLSVAHLLDTRDMIRLIEEHHFGLVIFRAQFYPADVKAAILRNYHTLITLHMNGFDYWILQPNS